MVGRIVTEELAERYHEDGIICLRGVFDRSWIDLLVDGFDQALAAPSPVAKDYAKDGAGSFYTDHHLFLRLDQFHRFLFDGPAAQIAAEIMGSTKINLYDEHLLVKEPGTDTPTWWHHDLPYFHIEGNDISSIWLPLDPVTEESGAMRFALGSHRWGKLFTPVRIGVGDPVAGSERATDLAGPVPDIDADPDRYPTVCHEMAPGDCVVFHGRTLHAAKGNSSPNVRRRALALRFAGDDIRWKTRASAAPVYTDLLEDGAPIDRRECPRVWPRAAQTV